MPNAIITFADAIDFLYSLQYNRWLLDLSRISALMATLDQPQRRYATVHIAGTNGKGSTAAMIENMLRLAGYKTGLYTSPHLVKVSERIQISGAQIPEGDLLRLTQQLRPLILELNCTFFEAVTAIAMQFFADQSVEIAVFETGLGGRLDATNVITPLVSVICPIALDHCEHLGDTLEKIALEKAGIIKPEGICLSAPQSPEVLAVLESDCRQKAARFFRADHFFQIQDFQFNASKMQVNLQTRGVNWSVVVNLLGVHQAQNAITALATIRILNKLGLKVPEKSQIAGLTTVNWPGRFQIAEKNPMIVLDVAHNPAGMATLVATWQHVFPGKLGYFILGILKDKAADQMVRLLAPLSKGFVVLAPDNSRALEAERLASIIKNNGLESVWVADSATEALEIARKQAARDEVICVTGSHYTVGQACEIFNSM